MAVNLTDTYDCAFENLGIAVKCEKDGNIDMAIFYLNEGIKVLQVILSLEPDQGRRQLIYNEIQQFSQKVFDLQQKKQEMESNESILMGLLEEESSRNKTDEKLKEARTILEEALSLDESGRSDDAVPLYISSVELYLEALGAIENSTVDPKYNAIRRQLNMALSRAEEIKKMAKDHGSEWGSQAVVNNEDDENESKDRRKSRSRSRTSKDSSWSGVGEQQNLVSRQNIQPRPIGNPSTRGNENSKKQEEDGYRLTNEEIDVLRRSSRVNGRIFLPWMDDHQHERFHFSLPWTDPEGLLPLSSKQQRYFFAWKRPSEFIGENTTMISAITPFSIVQDLVTDCSFVASLCIAAAFEKKTKRQLVTRAIYPQDRKGKPVYNPSGKYLVKLWFNGIPRKVIVDDLLPVGPNNELICSRTDNRSELWVSIIEKAYMKVNGGYDFPGSNSGIDLFALTGWIPEHIFFQENSAPNDQPNPQRLTPRQSADRAWDRLVSAHAFGDCLITVSTTNIDENEADALGIVPTHAYAVLDVRQINQLRLLQVKNPWASKRWKGAFSVDDTKNWTPELRAALNYDQESARQNDNGVFWIDYPSVLKYFKVVILNWNPELFPFRTVVHGHWPFNQGPKNDSFYLGKNPQYSLIIDPPPLGRLSTQAPICSLNSPTVWILVTRHVTRTERQNEPSDFLTLHIYDHRMGRRVFYPESPMLRGVYSNNPHTLICFDVKQFTPADQKPRAYTLVISQYEKIRDIDFTVNVFCTSSFRFIPTPPIPKHHIEIKGSWNNNSAGGKLGSFNFYQNPMWNLAVAVPSTIHIELMAPREFAVNILLVGGEKAGTRIESMSAEEEMLTSGDYRPGFCFAESTRLNPGIYTLIVSTFKPNQIGSFILNIYTSKPLQHIRPIAPEGDGRDIQIKQGSWSSSNSTAAGCSNHGNYTMNPKYSINCTQRTKFQARLKCLSIGIAVNVSIYPTNDRGEIPANCYPSSSITVASSNKGIYTDCRCGTATPEIELERGKYLIIISTFDPTEANYELIIFSFPKISISQI